MKNICIRCGKETEREEVYCPQCADNAGAPGPGKFWFFSVLFSLLLLATAGMLLWHGRTAAWDLSWDRLIGRPAAIINGEEIGRKDLQVRLGINKRMLEQQYGNNIFAGAEGKARLSSLRQEVLDRMVEERLIAQEARRLGIVISDGRVDQELKRIAAEIYGVTENHQQRFREEGFSESVLNSHIRHILTVRAVMQAGPAAPGPERGAYFEVWLAQAKKEAKLVVYDSPGPSAVLFSGSSGCCGAGGSSGGCGGSGGAGGCGVGGDPRPVDAETERKAGAAAIEAYGKTNGSTENLKTRVADYGCHIQVDIDKDGRTVKSYSYRDGRVFEI